MRSSRLLLVGSTFSLGAIAFGATNSSMLPPAVHPIATVSPTVRAGGPDTYPPKVSTLTAEDFAAVAPGRPSGPGQRFEAKWTGLSERADIVLGVYRPGSVRPLRVIRYGWREAGDGSLAWNGRGARGGLWAPGEYEWTLTFTDAAGNARVSRRRSVVISYSACGNSGRIVRFRVVVAEGLGTTRNEYAGAILRILCEERGWISSGKVRFVYDPSGGLLVGLRSPDQTERRCMQLIGLSVRRYYSCAGSNEVVMNSDRWFSGSDHLEMSVRRYRRMLTFHEVGHTMGQRHRSCTGSGVAPVMMQQSKGTGTCTENEYPTRSELRSL